jgi:hypothetical protein
MGGCHGHQSLLRSHRGFLFDCSRYRDLVDGSLMRNPRSGPDCALEARAIAGIAPPSVRCIGHSSNKSSLDLGVPLNTTSPGQSRGRAGASLLTADRLSWRVDLLTQPIYVPLGDSA